MITSIAVTYHLLSGDALIIAACRVHNITTVASLDCDFGRVEGFDVIFQ
jgi:predicted nucleic acid-binding protein